MEVIQHIEWNLLLALVAPVLSLVIGYGWWRKPALRQKIWIWLPLLVVWLCFLPNTCYLLTEWRHFLETITADPATVRAAAHDKDALLRFLAQATFYFCYSAAGLLTFSMAIWPIDRIFRPAIWQKLVFFLLCALGVYLGLIRRLNTWDVLYHPKTVLRESISAVSHPTLILLTAAFAGVIWFNYWIFEVFIDGLLIRLRRSRRMRRQPAPMA
ncbi:MAG: DUF1361 domain-containing protein [Chloroflexi bacterium]|nr:DUF1361 domain-containing protein [Chloroflexota bacterium]